MPTNLLPHKNTLFICLLALGLPILAGPAAALPASAPVPGQANPFDYTPAEGEQAAAAVTARPTMHVNLNDIEVIHHPKRGTIFVSKHLWKTWVERALYLLLLSIALTAITASVPKRDEHNIIISYFLTGINFTLAFWVFLCGVLLLLMKSASGFYVMPVSALMAAGIYYLLMKIKKADVSLTDLKDAFRHQRGAQGSDQRLAAVDGSPGDWPEQDFLK
ncbi:MAG: hypothetical protein A2234_01105 [Elusimicrobia bacterium RIFOXYA2_FULL_58_8]|nr:MAG: hypothetical protein A2234_01105 [Elusimicrobia bacterium RIFOXYA2_FULL_58_8]